MSAFSDFLEDLLCETILNNAATAVGAAALDVALYTTAEADDGATGVEVTGGSYARIAYTSIGGWTVATASGVTTAKNANVITFATATANWGLIVGFGLFVSTDLYIHGAVSPSVQINTNDTFSYAVNALVIELQ